MKEKQNSMKIIKAIFFVLFTTLVLFVFSRYSMLRPATCGALYKEPITAVFVILICFLNHFVLFPLLYRKRKFYLYVTLTLVSVMLAVIAEEVLVFPQIGGIIRQIGDLTLREFTILLTFSLMIRNLCFVGLFFLISLLEDAIQENVEINESLKRINNLIVVKSNNNKMIHTIPISDIVYCQQEENYTYLFTTEGNKFNKNCSLSYFANQLGSRLVVRISRNIIVFYKHIHSFDDNSVYVKISNGESVVGFNITDAYRENAIKLLKTHSTIPLQKSEVAELESDQSKGQEELVENLRENEMSLQMKEKQNTQSVLEFIQSHPDCKGSDIMDYFHTSLSTVNRILAQLKEEGLIEYVGSKKTGGYRVKS